MGVEIDSVTREFPTGIWRFPAGPQFTAPEMDRLAVRRPIVEAHRCGQTLENGKSHPERACSPPGGVSSRLNMPPSRRFRSLPREGNESKNCVQNSFSPLSGALNAFYGTLSSWNVFDPGSAVAFIRILCRLRSEHAHQTADSVS
ncbi:hypothetical protein ZHAS_00017725 [Anopheles sinensis]|uniref:Uncharacterized protein n=1 Tax=Anopheles sinensis TaxID=74873 RepID=A0A084WH27_ANOSI|nr:hypothetical protein ZHAS_00017725 [Anopheles sinensis]